MPDKKHNSYFCIHTNEQSHLHDDGLLWDFGFLLGNYTYNRKNNLNVKSEKCTNNNLNDP